ncbi:MAG: hypothetical protein AB1567_02545, partial [bacterium]
DLEEIPMLPDDGLFSPSYVNLHFGNYACDYRSKIEKEQVWEFVVERWGDIQEVEISWNIDHVPKQYYLYLKDKGNNKLIDLRKDSFY